MVFNNEKIKSEIAQLVAGKLALGDVLEYPKCCTNWMTNTKTKSLELCYQFYIAMHGKSDYEKIVKFLLQNFEGDIIPGNMSRMTDIVKNHVIKTISVYPFVFHQACTSCLKNSASPTARLNKKYEDFAKKVSKQFYQEILETGEDIV